MTSFAEAQAIHDRLLAQARATADFTGADIMDLHDLSSCVCCCITCDYDLLAQRFADEPAGSGVGADHDRLDEEGLPG